MMAAAPNATTDPQGYVASLKALLPPGSRYNEIGFALDVIARLFPNDLAKADPEDITRWVAEIDAGKRTDHSIRNDMFKYFVGAAKIQNALGVDAPTANALIAGTQKFSDVSPAPGQGAAPDALRDGKLIRLHNPAIADAPDLYYVIYTWRGVQLSYEVGDRTRLNELFGGPDAFDTQQTLNQAQYDQAGYVQAGSIDTELGSTEAIPTRIEREIRILGLEDLPAWIGNSPDALAIVAEAAAKEWSSGRLWSELEPTKAFQDRFGTALGRYKTGNVSIGDAVNQIVADENNLRTVLRPYLSAGEIPDTKSLQEMLNRGWTYQNAATVLESASSLQRDPKSLDLSNYILGQSGLPTLDEVGYINALNGYGPPDVIEALNTATAGRALAESGIDLSHEDATLIMELVNTSDRLLTADSWKQLAQQLSFNLIQNFHELDTTKLGIGREDLIAAAFGDASPSGKSSGEVLSLLARFERDRQAAGRGGSQDFTGFADQLGRLRIQGLGAPVS